MKERGKKNSRSDRAVEPGNVSSGPPTHNVEGGPPLAGAIGETGEIVACLAEIERLVRIQTEHARWQAANLAQAQDELVRAAGSVKDLALAVGLVARKVPVEPLALKSGLGSVAREVILLARVLGQIRDLSETSETTIKHQTAKIGELVEVMAETARGSLSLIRKLATLAEEIPVSLPVLSGKHLVAAEIECLSAELKNVSAEFGQETEYTSLAAVKGATALVKPGPQTVN